MTTRTMLPVDVYTATQERLRFIFQEFERINVSFSAGKDSTVLLHMACQEARAQKRRITGLFIDWEAQFSLTIEHARNMFQLYQDVLDPLWVCLPFRWATPSRIGCPAASQRIFVAVMPGV